MGIYGHGDAHHVVVCDALVLVGRLIGKGGENINKMQAISGSRIQIMQDNGTPFRQFSIAGSREQIERGKAEIRAIVDEAGMDMGGHGSADPNMTMDELPIPSGKVGMIIGKQGETIKRLQDQTGARLQMIQDDPYAEYKPLKLQGTQEAVAMAKRMVTEMLEEKDEGGSFSSAIDYSSIVESTRGGPPGGMALGNGEGAPPGGPPGGPLPSGPGGQITAYAPPGGDGGGGNTDPFRSTYKEVCMGFVCSSRGVALCAFCVHAGGVCRNAEHVSEEFFKISPSTL